MDPVWGIAVTKRLLVILEALSLWSSSSSSSRSDHQSAHGESKEGLAQGGRGSPSLPLPQSPSTLLADRRLCVEVAATVKLFVAKFAFVRQAFSFRASDLGPSSGMDRGRGDDTWDRRDGRDLFGRKDDTSARVAVGSSGGISSRILLLRVLRPITAPSPASSPSVRSTFSSVIASQPDQQVSPSE